MTPHPRLRLHPQFKSNILPDPRDIIVYLPPGYDQDVLGQDGHGQHEHGKAEQHPDGSGPAEPRRYPVLYLHDGQNLFDPETSFIRGRTWQVREAADEGIQSGLVEPLIIVGVYNTGERRLAEYTPSRDWKMGGGEADRYGQLLARELVPFIDAEYRTLQGPQNTGLGGSSLGGLVSLYLGLRLPEVFGKLAVLSPSVWWDHKRILGFVNELAPELTPRPRIWLDVGDHEGRRTLSDADLLEKRLRANGWNSEQLLHYEHVQGGTHDEAAWALRVLPIIRFLFPQGE